MKKIASKILIVVLVVASVAMFSGCNPFIKTNKGHADLWWYMNLTNEDSSGNDVHYTSSKGEVVAVALEDAYAKDYAIAKNGDCFLNIDTVKDDIDSRFYWDKNENKILFTDAKSITTVKVGSKEIIGETTDIAEYKIAFNDKKKCYVNLKFVQEFIGINYKVIKGTDTRPTIVSLDYKSGTCSQGHINGDIEMRTNRFYMNLIVDVVKKGSKVKIIKKREGWCLIKTEDGLIGWVPENKIGNIQEVTQSYKNDDDSYTHTLMNGRVSMVWNLSTNVVANQSFSEMAKKIDGVNVISPTWFELADKNGNIHSAAESDYVKKAHNSGMQVWALLGNFEDESFTKPVLTNTTARQNLVSNVMAEVKNNNVDGVNVDFESITTTTIDGYLQFLRELSIECRKNKIILSADNYQPAAYNEFYNYKEQYKYVDYLVIMNYDEFTGGSNSAGPVSSIPFMENGIKNTIDLVGDASRVINGNAFYTRLWQMTPEEKSSGNGVLVEDSINGNYYLKSSVLDMTSAEKKCSANNVTPKMDNDTGLNYVEYKKGYTTNKLWLEDATSVTKRLKAAKNHKLAGSAFWALGFEDDSIWKTIKDNN